MGLQLPILRYEEEGSLGLSEGKQFTTICMEEWRTSQNTSGRPSYLEDKNRNCDLPRTNSIAMGLNFSVFSR